MAAAQEVEENTIIGLAITVTDDLGGASTETITITITNSPDGIVRAEKVFFEQNNKLYVIDADGQDLKEFIPERPMVTGRNSNIFKERPIYLSHSKCLPTGCDAKLLESNRR